MERLWLCGIGLMVVAVLILIISVIAYLVSGKKLRKTLEQEYGKPQRYNS